MVKTLSLARQQTIFYPLKSCGRCTCNAFFTIVFLLGGAVFMTNLSFYEPHRKISFTQNMCKSIYTLKAALKLYIFRDKGMDYRDMYSHSQDRNVVKSKTYAK
jgi:hypothetical protein